MIELTDGVLSQVKADAAPKTSYREYAVRVDANGVNFPDGTVFTSASISSHLNDCTHCVVMAATLGHGIDRTLRRLLATDMASAVLYDECANALIEEICDNVQAEIEKTVQKRSLTIATRFSPGYGDFLLSHQPDVLRLSNAEKEAGILLSEHNLMLPQKSVTAIIGIKTR